MMHLKSRRILNRIPQSPRITPSPSYMTRYPALPQVLTPVSVFRVVVAGSVCGAEEFGEETDEDDAHGGHAGTHDADVDLDGGPVADVPLVPGWVRGAAEVDEGLEAEDGED